MHIVIKTPQIPTLPRILRIRESVLRLELELELGTSLIYKVFVIFEKVLIRNIKKIYIYIYI